MHDTKNPFQNAVYIVRPKHGYQGTPILGQTVGRMRDGGGRMMPGGGREWIFEHGSGGPGTVFGPIRVPVGSPPGPIQDSN